MVVVLVVLVVLVVVVLVVVSVSVCLCVRSSVRSKMAGGDALRSSAAAVDDGSSGRHVHIAPTQARMQ